VLLKFLIGRPSTPTQYNELFKEMREFDDLILYDIEDQYKKLPFKVF